MELEQLSQFKYPGRFLIIGCTETNFYAIYGVTARSAASRAKKYVYNPSNQSIVVEPTDKEIMSQGNWDLLSYNAAHIYKNGLVIGNGKQVDKVSLNQASAVSSLAESSQYQTYEPDKHQTPRITGALQNNQGSVSAALYIIKSEKNNKPLHQAYDLALQPKQAYYISTYAGPNVKPTPSFNGDPILLNIDFEDSDHAAQQVYDTLAPNLGSPDLRVSVIAIQTDLDLQNANGSIINYN